VSGIFQNGHTVWFRIESLAGEPCVVKCEKNNLSITSSSRAMSLKERPDGTFEIPLAKGDWVILSTKGEVTLAPVSQNGIANPWGTLKRPPPLPIVADEKGVVTLPASNALITGDALTYFTDNNRNTLGRWINQNDYPSWQVSFPKVGKYQVFAHYGANGTGGSFEIKVGEASLKANTQSTGGFENYQEIKIGEIDIASTQTLSVQIKVLAMKGPLGNFKGLRFEPLF
jgi:hypothetical protein